MDKLNDFANQLANTIRRRIQKMEMKMRKGTALSNARFNSVCEQLFISAFKTAFSK